MRWFRRRGGGPSDLDPARQEELLREVRRFGTDGRARPADEVAALTPLLTEPDGLAVAARLVQEAAGEAFAGVRAQISAGYPVDRRNYRVLWRAAGARLRTPLFELPGRLHPYVHLTAAAGALGDHADRVSKLIAPQPVVDALVELLDLVTASWEFGGVPADPDGADLVRALIHAAGQIRAVMPDEPAPLPPGIRELMRRNNTTPVVDPAAHRVVGGINVGAEIRPAFLT
ncbi:hypothetical protein Val02_56370 [Virgisporangium aliadipatigenens]|uniref:Uncharacterized protein n=1 Tax=Virgisporangium aliadipatigenens TaxID=741659 RepID=A0A8J3YP19_9ACTN|nr:hypothetical protein [Virgisporangium aliadipatigenens]GIJ48751.1 hypothetical protein Val02_56370 [Virgisporangium aliadipatigenens]